MQSEPADPIDADRLQASLNGVEGWLHFDEAAALASSSGGGRVLAVDPHTGSVEHRAEYDAVDTFPSFAPTAIARVSERLSNPFAARRTRLVRSSARPESIC